MALTRLRQPCYVRERESVLCYEVSKFVFVFPLNRKLGDQISNCRLFQICHSLKTLIKFQAASFEGFALMLTKCPGLLTTCFHEKRNPIFDYFLSDPIVLLEKQPNNKKQQNSVFTITSFCKHEISQILKCVITM